MSSRELQSLCFKHCCNNILLVTPQKKMFLANIRWSAQHLGASSHTNHAQKNFKLRSHRKFSYKQVYPSDYYLKCIPESVVPFRLLSVCRVLFRTVLVCHKREMFWKHRPRIKKNALLSFRVDSNEWWICDFVWWTKDIHKLIYVRWNSTCAKSR